MASIQDAYLRMTIQPPPLFLGTESAQHRYSQPVFSGWRVTVSLRFSFCEAKYYCIQPQFAEFANTLASRSQFAAFLKADGPGPYILPWALVGSASFWNYMTLRLDAQTVDQLSMDSMHFLSATLFSFSTSAILPTLKWRSLELLRTGMMG